MSAFYTPCQFVKKNFPRTLDVLRKEGRKRAILTPYQVQLIAHHYGIEEKDVIRDKPLMSEVGIMFCENQYGYIYPTSLCRGAGCMVAIQRSGMDRVVGTIHTHPGRVKLIPSPQDWMVEVFKNQSEWFGIISVNTRNMIFLWNFDEMRANEREALGYIERYYDDLDVLQILYDIQVCRGKY